MPQPLGRITGQRGEYTRVAVSRRSEIDIPRVVQLIDGAWRADYREQARLDFDEHFLHRATSGEGWAAVIVYAANGRPVGFELGFERTLHVRQIALKAFYVTAFSVSEQHRRRGLGRWVLEGMNELVLGELGADCIISTFHEGHGGSPTVQATFDAIDGYAVTRFASTPLFSLRFDELEPNQTNVAAPQMFGLTLLANGELKLLGEPSARNPTPSLAELEAEVRAAHEVGFGLRGTFAENYLQSGPEQGSLWFDFGDGARCWLTYSTVHVALDKQKLGACGELHTALNIGCSEAQIERALHALACRFRDQGCRAMLALDVGTLARPLLERLSFKAQDTTLTFAVRGPREIVAPFAGVSRPFFLDFT